MANSTRAGGRKKGAPHFHGRGERGSTTGQKPRHQAFLEGCYQNEGLVHSVSSLLGCCVEVELRGGEVYEGILRTASPEMDVALELAFLKSTPEQQISKNLAQLLRLRWPNIVSLHEVGGSAGQQKGSVDIFKTDSEISRTHANGDVGSRDLQPFQFDDGVSGNPEADAFEDEGKGWDVEEMLTVNKEKFNYKTCYNEDMREYTTQISESDSPEFLSRSKKAAQLEREIEAQKAGRSFDDCGTEEDRFSAVVRHIKTTAATTGASTVLQEPGPQSSSTPVSGREREEDERQGGIAPVSYDAKENRKDGKEDELETTAATAPDQDADTQRDSGLADSPVAGDSSTEKTSVDSKVEGGQPEAETDDRSCQDEPQSPKKQSPKELVRTFRLNPKATEFTPKAVESLTPVARSPVGPTQAAWESPSSLNPIPANTAPVGNMPRPPRKSPRLPRPAAPSFPLSSDPLAALCAGYNPAVMAAAAAAAIRPLPISGGGQVMPQLSLAATGASMTQPSAMVPVVRPQGLYPQIQGGLYNPPSFQLPAAPTPGQPLTQLFVPSSSQTQPQPVLSPQLASPTGQQQLFYLPTSSIQPLAGQGNTFLPSQPPPMGGGMPVVYPQHHHHHHGK